MNHFDKENSSFEEMRDFLIGDEEAVEKASMSTTIPFDIEELQEVPYYKRPLVQLLSVVGVGLPIIWLIMAAFKGGSAPTMATSPVEADPEKAQLVAALNQERARIQELELQNALYEQNLEVILPKPKSKPQPKPQPAPKKVATAAPKPAPVQPKPQPVYRAPAPRSQVKAAPAPKPQPVPPPQIDPMQQWLAIADQGHYTTSHVSPKSTPKLVSTAKSSWQQSQPSRDYPLLDDNQVVRALDNTPLLNNDELVARINGKTEPTRITPQPKIVSLSNAGNNIIDIGSSGEAILESAVVWSTASRNQSPKKYLLRLKEDFTNIPGKVVLPKDTRLIAQVRDYSNSGLLTMEITQILHQGRKIEIAPGALAIEGKKGSPLKADLKQKGDSDFWANVGSIVAPGIERAVDSAGDTIVVQNGSVYRSNSSRDPLASGAAGIADGVSRSLNRRIQRNQRESILDYFQLDAGKTVYLKAYEDISF